MKHQVLGSSMLRGFPACMLALILAGCGEEPTSPVADGLPSAAVQATGQLTFRQLSSGSSHTCGVTTENRAYCWGANGSGELGNGSTGSMVTEPVAVAGGLRFLEVRVGTGFTCGLTTVNRVYCWGASLGTEPGTSPQFSSVPAEVSGGRRFSQLRTGSGHACALTSVRVAFCWGDNSRGQLGDGTRTNRRSPIQVATGLRFLQIRAGGNHSCGVTTDRRAFCWGSNVSGQLGDGTELMRVKPVLVKGGYSFLQLSTGGGHTCGVSTANRAYCWGFNQEGQLGDGGSGFNRRHRPVAVAGALQFSGVGAGTSHTCAVTTNGNAYCWGWTFYGQLGDGSALHTFEERHSPVAVVGGFKFNSVVAGRVHTCGVTVGGQGYCWGHNHTGQLGDGNSGFGSDRSTPGLVAEPL